MPTLSDAERARLLEIVRRSKAGTLKPTQAARRDFTKYAGNPERYFADVLGIRLYKEQREMVESIEVNRYTASKACHGVGKTYVAAGYSRYWYDTKERSIVYITAPSWAQALGLTFKQLKQFSLEHELPGEILDSGMIRDPDELAATYHFIKAVNAERGEGFQGEHSAPMLIVLEEAVGVPGYIWKALKGLMTDPRCRVFVIGNPTDEANPFGEACSSPTYNTITVSVLNHPSITEGLKSLGSLPQGASLEWMIEQTMRQFERGELADPLPGGVSLLWLLEMLRDECQATDRLEGDAFEWPAGSGLYWFPNAEFQGRALGQFPTMADEQCIPIGWVRNTPPQKLTDVPEIGADIARHGKDRTGIATTAGPIVLAVREVRQMDTVVVAGAIKLEAENAAKVARDLGHRHITPEDIIIRVDVTGGLGAGPYDTLIADGYNAVPINSSELPPEAFRSMYPNWRSFLWFGRGREYAREKRLDLSRLPPDMRRKVEKELGQPKWKPNRKGQKTVQPKDEIKKDLGASPDLAEAVLLSWANDGVDYGLPAGGAGEDGTEFDFSGTPGKARDPRPATQDLRGTPGDPLAAAFEAEEAQWGDGGGDGGGALPFDF